MAIKKLQNDFTTPEQSKRLLELGVPRCSANGLQGYRGIKVLEKPDYDNPSPCWSVGRLNEIFKICSDNHIEIYDLDLKGTQIERAMQAFENYAKYNWLDFSTLEE